MRRLQDATNAPAPDADYPKSKIKDDTGSGDGVPVNEFVNGDIHQFFQKLVIDASITENNLPDNVTNGYQLVDALEAKIWEVVMIPNAIPGWSYIGNVLLPLNTNWSASASSALHEFEIGGYTRVSALVTYTGSGININDQPMPTSPSVADALIWTINDTDMQLKYPTSKTIKYFRAENQTNNTTIIIGIADPGGGAGHQVFVARGVVNTNDVLNLEYTYY